ncbi:MAG: LptF/LptG family permease [Prevotella sp.]|nr:LptF/LptG family permease [Prevotella sp.]
MFRIKKLDIFIVKQFGLLFIGTFFICQFVLMMQFLWRYVDELIGKGLSLEVMAQFFWYMGLMLMPQAFPLAILLSSLIAFGNLGESSELTAIKAAGISMLQAMRSLIFIVIIISGISFYFQEVIGPKSFISFRQLLMSMQQKNPEVEIPEGIFYDGISGSNIYVQKKDMNTGVLYGIMIYRMNGGYEDAAVILADSGRMQTTEEKKHLLLTLYSGEWFENMRSQDVAGSANVPYRRETFSHKRIVLDFDGDFNMADAGWISGDARSKGMGKILHDLDSIREFNDSVGHQFYHEAKLNTFRIPPLAKKDSLKVKESIEKEEVNFDTLFIKLSPEEKQRVMKTAVSDAQGAMSDLQFKADYSDALNTNDRLHMIEAINKVTLSLSCLIFFFIGAPLGAIIRKGGLGVPVIISVLVFIVYYILENTGMKMARDDNWTVWFGKMLGTCVLTPIAVFFTYKANNDSVVFNIDLYKQILFNMLGIRGKRHVSMKEVIIEDPNYMADVHHLLRINKEVGQYSAEHQLLHLPNPIKVFFRPGDDQTIRQISDELEEVIEDLSNTKDRIVIAHLNRYPIVATHAHTRPFRQKWLNIITGLILPLGAFFYIRMCRFRLRLRKDLHTISQTNEAMVKHITENITNNINNV